jgi:hypothetical protein
MKEEEILSKAAEKLALKASLKEKKEGSVKQKKALKKVVIDETCDIVPTVPQSKSKSEDDDCFILFQNVPLMNEINSILDVKKFKNYKKLSAGVRLARQLLDI